MMDFSKIINSLTLKEKLAQMTQLLGDYYVSDNYGKLMGLSYGFDVSEELVWNTGSILGLAGAAKLKRVQNEYLNRSRHKIPLLFMQDVIHGFRTIFPSPLALACSWEQDLIEEAASISAKEAAVSGVHVTFSPMVDLVRDPRWGRVIETTGEDLCGIHDGTEEEMQNALATAESSDCIILALGEHSDMSSEAGSRGYITLPEIQRVLANRIFEMGKPVIVVLINGRPLELGEIAEKADAILEAWFPGTEGGNAIADILVGDEYPSGRLTMSFPITIGQVPVYYNALPTGRPKGDEKTPERFVSRYMDIPNAPLYPFGYGLTYTDFSYGNITLSSEMLTTDSSITAKVNVKNTGEKSGTETVQMYIRDIAGSMSRPVLELKGYNRITLEPGEETQVEFAITENMLKFNTLEHGFAAENGRFKVYIGKNANDLQAAEFVLKEKEQ